MIKSKIDLKYFLKIEKKIYSPIKFGTIIGHENTLLWKYIKTLRKLEFFTNNNKKIRKIIYKVKWYKLSNKFSIRIPENTTDVGLSIAHIGNIQINKTAKVGKNCRIHIGVVVGGSKNGVPIIGDNVYLGAGCKIYSNCIVGNNVRIAPNACVSKNIPSDEIWGGVPAHFIKENKKTI